jgi:AcrR family transcriptional regulator
VRTRGGLTKGMVLDGAMRIIDEEGLEALTMRRLGQRLDRNPMILYRHAASRAELLDAVVERVFALLEIPAHVASWQDRLLITAHRFRRIALNHPNVVPLLATRPLATPLGLRPLGTLEPLEHILGLLQDAGFAAVDALSVYRSYFALLLGHVLAELQEVVANPDETDDLLRLGLHRLPPRDFPHIRGLADALATYDGAAELDRSMTILLTGLSAQLRPGASPPAE